MVKKRISGLLVAVTLGATLVACGSASSTAFVESATDLMENQAGLRLLNESFIGSDSTVSYSQTFAQYGTDTQGRKCLRFATAVKGDITSLVYTRSAVSGVVTEDEKTKTVESVYLGITASGSTYYYDGSALSTKEADKGKYYWACYTICFTNSAYYDVDVTVTLSVNGTSLESKVANLNDMMTADQSSYKSIYIDGDVRVQHGQNINTAELVVKAINHDGSEITLDSADYSITNSKIARFGEAATVEIVHNQDSKLTASKEVITTRRVEAESGTIVGGNLVTDEPEYSLVNGELVKGAIPNVVGGFSGAIKAAKEGSLTLTYFSKTAHTGGLTMKISNSNLAGSTKNGPYYMKDLQLNSIVDISVNGTNVSIADDVIIEGTPDGITANTYPPLYGIYQNISFDNIAFNAGANTLKFNFKKSTLDETNIWEESPSEFNIDYVDFYSVGSNATTVSPLTLGPNDSLTTPKYATKKGEFFKSLNVIGTTESGQTVAFDTDELDITLTGGDHSYMVGTEDYIVFGEHTLTIKLLENEALLSRTYTFIVREEDNTDIGLTRIQNAWLEQKGDKVYYIISGTSRAVKPGDAELFNENTIYPTEWTFGLNTYTCRFDVTDKEAGFVLWPHFRVNGKNWDGSKGDVKITGSDAKAYNVEFGGKKYSLAYQYEMPTLTVSAA